MPTLDIPTARRRPVLFGAVVLTRLIGAGTWRLLPSDPEASPDEVVSDFFQAQRDSGSASANGRPRPGRGRARRHVL